MRNHFSHIAIAILTAASAVACANNAPNNDRRDQSGGNRGVDERVSLQGCVQAGPGTNAYELRGVNEAEPERQPQGQDRMEHAPLIERGSWVRLAGGTEDLKNYVGKHVSVTGEIRDRGTNTIGTSGQASEMPRAGEANGQPPLVAIERISESSGSCQATGSR
jgi:hypothetical protein